MVKLTLDHVAQRTRAALVCVSVKRVRGGARASSNKWNGNWSKLWACFINRIMSEDGLWEISCFKSLEKQQGYFQNTPCERVQVLPSNWCSFGMKSDRAVYVHLAPCPGWSWLLCSRYGIMNSEQSSENKPSYFVQKNKTKEGVGRLGIHIRTL